MQQGSTIPSLGTNQRNLYLYFLNHRKKHKSTPCYVPRASGKGSLILDYLSCIESCEKKGLFKVDRTAPNYTGWILLPIEP